MGACIPTQDIVTQEHQQKQVWISKETVGAYLKMLFRHWPGVTEITSTAELVTQVWICKETSLYAIPAPPWGD
jgi:hypothetical protein